jgi:hypothetical protein
MSAKEIDKALDTAHKIKEALASQKQKGRGKHN